MSRRFFKLDLDKFKGIKVHLTHNKLYEIIDNKGSLVWFVDDIGFQRNSGPFYDGGIKILSIEEMILEMGKDSEDE